MMKENVGVLERLRVPRRWISLCSRGLRGLGFGFRAVLFGLAGFGVWGSGANTTAVRPRVCSAKLSMWLRRKRSCSLFASLASKRLD